METGIYTSSFPYGDGSVTNPYQNTIHTHLGIDVKNPQKGILSIWGSTFPYGELRMETGRQTNKLPFGESPFRNTIHAHLVINIYASGACPEDLLQLVSIL